MVSLPEVNKFENIVTCFDTVHEHDSSRRSNGQTEGQTPHNSISCLSALSVRYKNAI